MGGARAAPAAAPLPRGEGAGRRRAAQPVRGGGGRRGARCHRARGDRGCGRRARSTCSPTSTPTCPPRWKPSARSSSGSWTRAARRLWRARGRHPCVCRPTSSAVAVRAPAASRVAGRWRAGGGWAILAARRGPCARPRPWRATNVASSGGQNEIRDISVAGCVAGRVGLSRRPGEDPALDRHRRHRGRVLPDGRRDGQRAVEVRARAVGDRGGDGRLGRQPEAHRERQVRSRLDDGRRRVGCLPRRGQVQGRQGHAANADGAVPEPHARRDDRGHRHQQARRSQGQARVDRLAGQRDRDHGLPGARGGRASTRTRTSSRSGSVSPSR